MLPLDQLLNGVVIAVDKPRQWSSFQVVNKVKSIIRNKYGLKKFKIGHAGTLDPLATGLLLICIGKATKQIELLQQGEKIYSGTMVFGATTPCFDLERPIDNYYTFDQVSQEAVEYEAARMTGEIEQLPPNFSAIKVDGVRAYEIARNSNTEIAITPKKVMIHKFQITDFREGESGFIPPTDVTIDDIPKTNLYQSPLGVVPKGLPQADFLICCGKGTYIRSIARDMGKNLGSGAFLSSLRRLKIGDYTIEKAYSMENLNSFFDQSENPKNAE
ncbi:MAG: tRNA pseudouridine(55) synthase TruB [Bacteroidales bacterium]|nr:tRNA pseudouridine(55) synthase TruB [Bacteroidales bacterium]